METKDMEQLVEKTEDVATEVVKNSEWSSASTVVAILTVAGVVFVGKEGYKLAKKGFKWISNKVSEKKNVAACDNECEETTEE